MSRLFVSNKNETVRMFDKIDATLQPETPADSPAHLTGQEGMYRRKESNAEFTQNVVMTRDSDRFIALEERTAIANSRRADLFISIHANASPARVASGVETYFLSPDRAPQEDADTAARARQHNNANVLCLAGKNTVAEEAARIVDAFLGARFEGGRHQRRINKMETRIIPTDFTLRTVDPEIFELIERDTQQVVGCAGCPECPYDAVRRIGHGACVTDSHKLEIARYSTVESKKDA